MNTNAAILFNLFQLLVPSEQQAILLIILVHIGSGGSFSLLNVRRDI